MNKEETIEIRAEINESLKLGVPIDTILANLQNRGIDVFDFHQQEQEKENKEKSEIELVEDALKKAKEKFKWVKILFVITLIFLIPVVASSSIKTVLLPFGIMALTWFNNSEKIKKLEAHLEFLNSNEDNEETEEND